MISTRLSQLKATSSVKCTAYNTTTTFLIQHILIRGEMSKLQLTYKGHLVINKQMHNMLNVFNSNVREQHRNTNISFFDSEM